MIEFGKENKECGKIPPYVISCNEIIDEEHANNTLEILVGVESGNVVTANVPQIIEWHA